MLEPVSELAEKINAWAEENSWNVIDRIILKEITGRDNFVYADLTGANLNSADLREMNFTGAILRYANLTNAHLDGAVLESALLSNADLSGADLTEANLHRATAMEVNFSHAILTEANLSGAWLSGSNLKHARLVKVNFLGTDLRQVILSAYGWVGGILEVTGIHEYQAQFIPTPSGWVLKVGCWQGTVGEFREMIAGEDWPATPPERQAAKRPALEALAAMCEAHVAQHSNLIYDLRQVWADDEEEVSA